MLEKEFLEFGFTQEEFKRIRNYYSVQNYGDEALSSSFKNIKKLFLEFGYTEEALKTIIVKFPVVLCYTPERLKEKLDCLVDLGYEVEDIIKMTTFSPSLLAKSINTIRNKFDKISSLGYTKDETIKVTKKNVSNLFRESLKIYLLTINVLDIQAEMEGKGVSYIFLEELKNFAEML